MQEQRNDYYRKSGEEVLKEVGSGEKGLSPEEAERRLEKYGRNRIEEAPGKSLVRRFFDQMADPMIIILLVAAVVSGALSAAQNESFADTIIIMIVVIVNAVLGVYQENKAEKAIEALREMAAATSKVVRGGRVMTVKSEELVPGDVILLEAGDAVPADGRIIESAGLRIEEAALTGESVPVSKILEVINAEGSDDVPLGDRKNMVYQGSTVVYGRGRAVVTETGMKTEMGKIADALTKAEEGLTPLQIQMAQLSKILTWLVLGICVVIFIVQILRVGHPGAEAIVNSFMIAVSLAVAAIPEGLAAVVTIVLSLGVTNMSEHNAIIRKLTAVETLGCAQIICSDKTGTLTQNSMTVVESHSQCPEQLARAMALCCDAEIDEEGNVEGEPTEAALVRWAADSGAPRFAEKKAHGRVAEAPFDSGRKMMSVVCSHGGDGGKYVQYSKGAPDVLLRKCTKYMDGDRIVDMTDELRSEISAENKSMADKALRVLAAGCRFWDEVPDDSPENLEHDLIYIGLCGMIDPVRPEVKAAIDECRDAGIRPVMITGDHIDTARAIASELGILDGGRKAVTGAELDAMSDEEFEKEILDIGVYARVQPEHKTRIVNTFRKLGYVTAMTGDGVNDAPSIKSADIGVGMGITGTDVTKNVADMVLADDNFATIVGAVEEGRRIYANIRKAIQFLLGSNMSEVLSIFAATLMGFTILKPVHLLWINLITDCFPALALGLENAEPGIMKKPPRSPKAGIFAGGMGFDIGYQGLVVTVLVLLSYFTGHYVQYGVWEATNSPEGMTMAFMTMSMAEIFHSFNMRSQRGSIFKLGSANKFLWGAALVSLAATTVVCEVPVLARAFGFTAVGLGEYAMAIGFGFLVIPVVEIVKFFQRKRERRLAGEAR
jgi:Ca2+-transporting ATPase